MSSTCSTQGSDFRFLFYSKSKSMSLSKVMFLGLIKVQWEGILIDIGEEEEE